MATFQKTKTLRECESDPLKTEAAHIQSSYLVGSLGNAVPCCGRSVMSSDVAVVLSGCGVFDGTEIHEISAVCAALSRAGKKIGRKVLYISSNILIYHLNNSEIRSQFSLPPTNRSSTR